MADAAHMQQKPFAGDAAGMEYFASEAHYRLLAANIRDQLQQHGGCVVLTGEPAPNSDLLVRHLTVVGAQRCRATVIKCHAQMSAAGLMDNYRRLVGSTIEAVTRRVASWSTQPMPATRGRAIDILVLDNVESLDDEVLRQLCCPPADAQEHWPPRLLVAGESLVERLAARSLEAVSSTIGARFHLHRLVQREAGSFIRYQLTAADLDQLDIFKPQVLELIEIYADGDPVVVNDLARRILKIVPELAARRRRAPIQETDEDRGTETATPAVSTGAPVVTESVAPDQMPPEAVEPAVLAIPEVLPAQAPVATPPQESIAMAVVPPATPPSAQIPDVCEVSAPAEAEPPVAEVPEPVSAPAEPSAAIEATPLIETVLPPAQRSEQASAPPAVEPPIIPLLEPVLDIDTESAPSEAVLPAATALAQVPSLTHESVPAAAETPIATVADSPAKIAIEVEAEADTEPTASNDREVPVTSPPRKRRHLVALSCALVAAIVAVAVTVGATLRRDAEGTYLDAAVKFARSTSLFASATKMSTGLIGASEPVPKDLGTQRLRTTTNDASQNLLTAAEPTAARDTNGAKAEKPKAISPSRSAAPAPPIPQELSHPVAANPPASPSEIAVVAVAAPPAPAPVRAPAPVVLVPPIKHEAPAATVTSPPPPIHEPPSTTASVAPVKHEAPEVPVPKDAAAPTADRTLSNADIGLLLHRGDQLLASGDIVAARHYFEVVAEAGDARAALRLGKTYDPVFLHQNGARGIAGDPVAAKSWYLKAIASGDREADMQLLRLMTLYP